MQAWTGEETTGDALLSTLQRLPHAEWVVTTLGSRGCVFLQRSGGSSARAEPERIDDVLGKLWERAQSSAESAMSQDPACTTPDGTPIRYCHFVMLSLAMTGTCHEASTIWPGSSSSPPECALDGGCARQTQHAVERGLQLNSC